MTCPRSHADLRHRNADIKIEDLAEGMRAAYEDALKRGCGCAAVPRYVRTKEDEGGE